MKNVIDCDNNKIIERFNESETNSVLEKYQKDERWEDVGIDSDGDICLWEEL